MISYAQNFEDVMLWRALKDVNNGFYIDVGANDPVEYSVTKWFYDQGWSGLNIEPSTEFYKKIEDVRSRDINLCVGAGNESGNVAFYSIPETGLSTVDKDIAERHKENGFMVEETNIEIKTLSSICDKYVKDKTIHFLKIDVEGSEENVLAGMDFKRYRPWIVVVEATEPMSEKKYTVWEDTLFGNDYSSVYFDGINKFYVSNEKIGDLSGCFEFPPTPFDGYVLQDVVVRDAKISVANKKIEVLEKSIHELEQHIQKIEKSFSWRITKPIRYFKSLMQNN